MLLESASIGASTRVVRIIVGVVPDAPLVVPCFFVACVRFSVSLVLPHTYAVRQKGPVEFGWWDPLYIGLWEML